MSNVIRKGHELTSDIHAFDLQDVSTTSLYNQGSVFTLPQVIRDATDCPYPIEAYPLYDIGNETPAADVNAACLPAVSAAAASIEAPATAAMPPIPDAAAVVPDVQQRAGVLLQQAQEEADRCLARAHEAAGHCLAQAQEQATAVTEAAYNDGFGRGEEAAGAEVAERFRTLFAGFQQALEAFPRLRLEALKLAEEDIITLALQLAQKIVRYEADSHRQVLAPTLQRALAALGDCDRVLIRVNPADLEQAQALQPHFFDHAALGTAPAICSDASVSRGGCVVDSEFGSIDARIESQFAELEQHLRAQLSQEGSL